MRLALRCSSTCSYLMEGPPKMAVEALDILIATIVAPLVENRRSNRMDDPIPAL